MRSERAWVAGLAALGLLLAALGLYRWGPSGAGWLPGCLFHRITGLACPGCGMTRATCAALHGRFGEALRFNPLGVILAPVVVVFGGVRLRDWLHGEARSWGDRWSWRAVWWVCGVVFGYWVLRNLPWWPFTLLAPP